MAGADYLAMVSDPEELLSIVRSIDDSKIAQLFLEYQQITQTMTEVGQFVHDVDGAASGQLFGKFVDEAHHESAVLSYAALNIADTCNRMKAKLSNFHEQYVEKVRPAAEALQQAYDAQLGKGGVGSPAELRTASTALAKALGHLYTDLAGNPTINVVPTFPEASIPDIGADGRRTAAVSASSKPGAAPTAGDGPAGSQAAEARQSDGAGSDGLQAAPEQAASAVRTDGDQTGGGQQAGGQPAGAADPASAAVVGAGGSGQAPSGGAQGTTGGTGQIGTGQGATGQGKTGQGKAGQGGDPASALGGVLGALGQVGSAAGSGLAGAAGAVAGAAGTGVGVVGDAVGLGASLGSSLGGLAAQPASAEGTLSNGLADSGDEAEIGEGAGSSEPAATKPAADLSTGGGSGGGSAHALPEARVSPAPELRPAQPASPIVEVSAGGPAAASNGMMGMPMMGGAGMNSSNGEHRVANYLISKEQGERQFTAGLPLASEEILGDLDERERLAMQIASIDEPGGEPR